MRGLGHSVHSASKSPPTHLGGSPDFVTGEAIAKPPRNAGIEEDPHARAVGLLRSYGL